MLCSAVFDFSPHFRKSDVSATAFGLQMFRIQQENGRSPRLCMHFLMLLITNRRLQPNRLKASSLRALFRLRWSCSATKIFSVGFLLIPLVAPCDQYLTSMIRTNDKRCKTSLPSDTFETTERRPLRFRAFARHERTSQIDMPHGRSSEAARARPRKICQQT